MEKTNDEPQPNNYVPQSINEILGLSNDRAGEMLHIIEDTYNELTSREGGAMQTEVMQMVNERVNPQNMVEAYFVGYYFGHRLWMERYMPDESDLVDHLDA